MTHGLEKQRSAPKEAQLSASGVALRTITEVGSARPRGGALELGSAALAACCLNQERKAYADMPGRPSASTTIRSYQATELCSAAKSGGQGLHFEASDLDGINAAFDHVSSALHTSSTRDFGLGSMDEVHGGSPFGASNIAGLDGSFEPSALELGLARFQGLHCGRIHLRLAGSG